MTHFVVRHDTFHNETWPISETRLDSFKRHDSFHIVTQDQCQVCYSPFDQEKMLLCYMRNAGWETASSPLSPPSQLRFGNAKSHAKSPFMLPPPFLISRCPATPPPHLPHPWPSFWSCLQNIYILIYIFLTKNLFLLCFLITTLLPPQSLQ